MTRQKRSLLATALLVLLAVPSAAAARTPARRASAVPPAPDKTAAPKEAAFHDAMRKLWEEHIT